MPFVKYSLLRAGIQVLQSRQKQLTLYRDYRSSQTAFFVQGLSFIRNIFLCTGTIVHHKHLSLYRDYRSSQTAFFVQGLPSRQKNAYCVQWLRLARNSLLLHQKQLTVYNDYRSSETAFFVQDQKQLSLYSDYRSSQTAYLIQGLSFFRNSLLCIGTTASSEKCVLCTMTTSCQKQFTFAQGLPPVRNYFVQGKPLVRNYFVQGKPFVRNRLLCRGTAAWSGIPYFVQALPPVRNSWLYSDCRSSGTANFVQGYLDYRLVGSSLLCTGTTVSSGTAYLVQGLPSRQEPTTLYRLLTFFR